MSAAKSTDQELREAVERLAQESLERKYTEKKLQEQIYRNAQILQTAIDGYLVTDLDGRILEVYPAAVRIYCYPKKELIGMHIRALQAEDPEKIEDEIKIISKQKFARFETRQRCKDGTIVDLEASIHLIDMKGKKFYISFFHDITEKSRQKKC